MRKVAPASGRSGGGGVRQHAKAVIGSVFFVPMTALAVASKARASAANVWSTASVSARCVFLRGLWCFDRLRASAACSCARRVECAPPDLVEGTGAGHDDHAAGPALVGVRWQA